MGVFDYLRCEMPLPVDWAAAGGEFQTNDTDAQYLERYTITADGRLVHHAVRYEDVPQSERPYPDAAPDDWRSICGSIRRVPIGDVEVPFHGDLTFGAFDRERGDLSITARFTEGRVVRMWHEWTPSHDKPDVPPPRALTRNTNKARGSS